MGGREWGLNVYLKNSFMRNYFRPLAIFTNLKKFFENDLTLPLLKNVA